MVDFADNRRQMPVIVKQRSWVGGVHDFVPRDLIPDNTAIRMENVETHMHGTVRRRGGLRLQYTHTATSSDQPLLLKAVNTIRGVEPFQVAVYNTDVSTSVVTIDQGPGGQRTVTVGAPWVFDQRTDVFPLLDRVYFTKEGLNPLYWENGATSLQEERATPGSSLTSIPKAMTGTYFQGRGWVGGNPAAPDLVYFSSALGANGNAEAGRSPFTWDQDFQAFRMVTGRVEAIVPFRNAALVVFTDRGIETLEPNCCDILNTHRLTLNPNTGCVNRHTVQVCGEDIFFMDQEGHIRSLSQTELDESRGVTNQPLSLKINNVIERQTKARLAWARSGVSKGIYWIWMPTDGSQYANEGWGWSIRDQAWIGPYFLQKDDTAGTIAPATVGGITSCRFTGDQERTYILMKNAATAIKSEIAFEPIDLTDDGTVIPVVVETRAYNPTEQVRKTWQHVEFDLRFIHSPGDATFALLVETRPDEGAWATIGTLTVSPDAGPHLPVDLPFALTPYTRQEKKLPLTTISLQSYNLQQKLSIRDSTTTWELLSMLMTGHPLNMDYAI